MKITFKNGSVDLKAARHARSSVKSSISGFFRGMRSNNEDKREDAYTSLCEYGLSFDYVTPEPDSETLFESYFRYQIAWGGPSYEIRFYWNQGARRPYRIEFVYLDWFVGVGFDITSQEWAQDLAQWFEDCGSIRAEFEKAMADY